MSLKLRSSLLVVNNASIYTAGEKEYYTTIERKEKGIPINKSIQKDLEEIKEELGLYKYNFHF